MFAGGDIIDEYTDGVPDDASSTTTPTASIATPADALLFANGHLAEARITHWCNGCCTNEAGVTTREIQERNMVSALRVLVGYLFTGQKPSASRWLSTGRMLAYLTCGFVFLQSPATRVAPCIR